MRLPPAQRTGQPMIAFRAAPTSQRVAARKDPAVFGRSGNDLPDADLGVPVDGDAGRLTRRAEVGSTPPTLERREERSDPHPMRLIADTAFLLVWLVERKTATRGPVLGMSERPGGTQRATSASVPWGMCAGPSPPLRLPESRRVRARCAAGL